MLGFDGNFYNPSTFFFNTPRLFVNMQFVQIEFTVTSIHYKYGSMQTFMSIIYKAHLLCTFTKPKHDCANTCCQTVSLVYTYFKTQFEFFASKEKKGLVLLAISKCYLRRFLNVYLCLKSKEAV